MQHFTNIIDALGKTLFKLECNCNFKYKEKSAIPPKGIHITQLENGFKCLILELIDMRVCFKEIHVDITHLHTPSNTTSNRHEKGTSLRICTLAEPTSILFTENKQKSTVKHSKTTRPYFNKHNCLTW